MSLSKKKKRILTNLGGSLFHHIRTLAKKKKHRKSHLRNKNWVINTCTNSTESENIRAAVPPAETPLLCRDASSCSTAGLCCSSERRDPGESRQWQPHHPVLGGLSKKPGRSFICDNLCDKCKAAPILSLIMGKACDGEIIRKVVRYCQTPVKAKGKCHFPDNDAVLSMHGNRVHYAKKAQDGQFGRNSGTLDRQMTASF